MSKARFEMILVLLLAIPCLPIHMHECSSLAKLRGLWCTVIARCAGEQRVASWRQQEHQRT
eukprot:4125074-Amphidinium_carterae.1